VESLFRSAELECCNSRRSGVSFTALDKDKDPVHRIGLLFVASLIAASAAFDQVATHPPVPAAESRLQEQIAHIAGQAFADGGAAALLQSLTDEIGGRVTGSPQSREASEWILKELKDAGYDSAHFEEYALETAWKRGPAEGEILSPAQFHLHVGAYGWVPGTNGRVESRVVDLGSPPSNDLPGTNESLSGAAIIVDVHSIGNTPGQVMRAAMASQLARAGAAAMLIPSDKPGRMLYTSAYGMYPRAPIPILSIGKEDTAFLRRLLARGPVKIALDIKNSFERPQGERNVIADLPGEHPDEVTLLGAHFDSWDPAQGADDNGTGVAAVLEAARILKRLGVKPRTTIRFAFFSGEEEGNLGSLAYIDQHKAELGKLRAFLLMDSGAQTPQGFYTNGREDVASAARRVLLPLASLGDSEVTTEADLESDNGTFMTVGVPCLTLKVAPGDYEVRHHAVTDTFDNVNLQLLARDTAVIAVASWLVANQETRLAPLQSASEIRDLFRKTGLESGRDLLFRSLPK
jgi:carboxypeptidase Q